MATAVWDRQYAGMESRESFQRSGPADREGICLGNEKFINFAYWIGGEGYSSSSGISANRFRYMEILGITIAGAVIGACLGRVIHGILMYLRNDKKK